jgi:hypothetical protein
MPLEDLMALRRDEMKTDNATKAVFGVAALWMVIVASFWGAVIYAAIHFLKKLW